ncbi:MAG: DUF3795 domain-containing protein [Deltaproteobacteria bacterium]|nr:DUF3795 domain-containing protein [Deltaproteobacteria bacterium]MBW1946809.1 DUF3795 domain-containing protein [Deltaproteobacteria bacterium]MBW1967158.1 DUF3795 domain-containing protein [Deltaproteobacteria bacterium]MBW2098089.1 DUF3795 domain-containing protein [Deltaproteobacteria bacterium]RLB77697.1 MAG: hypothetical protein DRH15_10985 [Deltaproteobacteria bacterium]
MLDNNQDIIVACCGLICSKCGLYINGKCRGCRGERPVFRNCKIRKCNMDNGYDTCADCRDFQELRKCNKLNNIITKLFGLISRTDRIGNLDRIREIGLEKFKSENM